MKNFFLLILCLAASFVGAQPFHRGAIVFDLNTGMEAYNTTSSYEIEHLLLTNDTTVNDEAASVHLAMGIEVGLGRRIGVGVRGKANSYFHDVDAVTGTRKDVRSTDLMVMVNWHPVVISKFDLIIGAEAGYSSLYFDSNDRDGTIVSGKGGFVSVYVNPRIYIRRFGFNLKVYVPYIDYNELEANQANLDQYMISRFKANGIGVSAGIQFRLF